MPESAFATVMSPYFWLIVVLLMTGVVAGGIYNIAMPVLVAYLVPEDRRDNANGLYGMVNGLGFGITSVASGLMLGYLGMYWVLITAVIFTILGILALSLVEIREEKTLHAEHTELPKKIDLKGTIAAVNAVPGLMALIIFTTFNSFLGGVFMSLMDAYGLSLVNVQTWGLFLGSFELCVYSWRYFDYEVGSGKKPCSDDV